MKPRRWFWYFAALMVLATLAAITPLYFNVRMQLTPERVAAACQRWREHGPRDYDLDYVERVDTEARGDEFVVQVRDGKVTAARRNGEPTTDPVMTVDTMLDFIESALAADQAAGRSNYTVADFDRTDGHPVRYVHRARGTHERLEWRVRVRPVTP